MTKHLRFLFVMLLAMIWSAGRAQEVTMNFTDNTSWNFSTDSKNTKSGTYGKGNCAVSLTGGNYYFTNNKCLMLKKKGTLTFATFNFDVEKIVITGNHGASPSTKQNIYVGNVAVSSETIGSTATNTYLIKANYQSAGNRYVLKVFDANAQITKIQIYKKGSSSNTKTDTKVSFSENSGKTFTFTEGKYSDGTFTTPTATETTGVAGTIAYSSSNATAISVDASTGALTFKGYGKATITATFTPNDTEKYAESTDSYIVVNKHDVGDAVFYESFDKCAGKGGNDGTFGSLTNGVDLTATNADNEGWKFTQGYVASKCVRFGTRDNAGSATTPSITVTGKGDLSFMAAAWKGDGTTITVSVSDGATLTYNGKTSSSISVNINRESWTNIDNIEISGAKTFTITFAANGKNNRFFLDEVMVKNVAESGETTTIELDENSESNTIEAKTGVNVTLKRTMVANEWNTICLPFDVSKEQAQTAFGEGVKIAELNAGSTGTTLSFNSVNEISATKPYLIKPSKENTSNEYVFKNVNVAKNDPDAVVTGGSLAFKGIFNMVDITKDVTNIGTNYYAAFLGADNKIYKVKANGNKTKGFRAYFAIPNSASASALRVVIDGTATSIKNIDSEVVESDAPVYNLQGQRVDGNNLTPGIYVKAGKKFVVK